MSHNILIDGRRLRRKYWLQNSILSFLLKINSWSRKKNIWVFGCWAGQRYDDSCRYVYEYILEFHPEISPCWITKNVDVEHYLKSQGKPVLLANSNAGKKMMLKAGVAFYSNGLDDFSNKFYLSGAMIVNLNHAPIALKELKYFNFEEKNFVIKALKKIKRYMFNWFYFDYTIVPSKIAMKSWMRAFCQYNSNRYFISGLPRYDVLCNQNYIKKEVPYFFKSNEKYILYLPTYRRYKNNVIDEFISEITKNKYFQEVIEASKYKIVIKPHFADLNIEAKDISNNNLLILDSNVSFSTQELLSISDILITDYSSCCVDFSITGRPVLLYTPDFNQYKESNGISEEFEVLYQMKNLIMSPSELLTRLINIVLNKNTEMEVSDLLRNNINLGTLEPPYSKTIVDFVINKLGQMH